jgi:hypothetical protein
MMGLRSLDHTSRARRRARLLVAAGLAGTSLAGRASAQVTVTGVDARTGAQEAVASYRWTLEHDLTYRVRPGVPDPFTASVSFHRSYVPVVAQGRQTDSPFAAIAAYEAGLPACGPSQAQPCLDPANPPRYFLSVLPDGGYSMSGAPIAPGQASVAVFVNRHPIPTAQITVLVFQDSRPINNAPDLPEEGPGACPGPDCMEGFTIKVEDAGGRYGASSGQQSQDAFGNPLGTSYRACRPDEIGNPTLCPYPGNRTVDVMGTGVLRTDADGRLTIRNLAPGKYGIQAIPPAGQSWVQTSTIEGTKVVDAWVKAGEPPYFQEFGPPGYHAFLGFVRPMQDGSVLNGAGTISGRVTNLHMSRPPEYAFYSGAALTHTRPWVGLNDLAAAGGRGVYAQRVEADGSFTIPNVPSGNYQVVVWDDYLDVIFALQGVRLTAAAPSAALGDLPVFNWFTQLHHFVFEDRNANGVRDEGEAGIPEQVINLRFRDGSLYQSFPTDRDGFVPFDEVFPFFSWLVAEVDYTRFDATGVTVVVDGGGELNRPERLPAGIGLPADYVSRLTPQAQSENGGLGYRTETGPVLLQGVQGFIGQTSVMMWGKRAYPQPDVDNPPRCQSWGAGGLCLDGNFPSFTGDDPDIDDGCYVGIDDPCPRNGLFDSGNGGISGIVHYSTTRAEDDPRLGAAEPWEPGIPGVRVELFSDVDQDGRPDDRSGDGVPDAIQAVRSDSWDDAPPRGCQGEVFAFKGRATDCFDGLRNFNQVRPALFDGGYAFTSRWEPFAPPDPDNPPAGFVELPGLPAGDYVVRATPPPGYEIVKEEDKNVDFGDEFEPAAPAAALAAPGVPLPIPVCVGAEHDVPAELALFPGVPVSAELVDVNPVRPGVQRPLCDAKLVPLRDGQNAAANFFLFTATPVAGHIHGFILDDLSNEFDPSSPQFGEKYAPPWLPVSIRDFTGREIARVYSDEYGVYDALVPSTHTANLPQPSGMGPNMLTVCLNDPSIPNADGTFTPDPYFSSRYSQFCYTFQYMPGTTTYLDTPVLPVGAFSGPDQFPVDCELPAGTPVINRVTGPAAAGPFVPFGASLAQRTLTIVSQGQTQVPNPAYAGPTGTAPALVERDYGFGSDTGVVTLGGNPIPVLTWTAGQIVAVVPSGAQTGQLLVTRANGSTTVSGVTVHVGRRAADNTAVRRVSAGQRIQAAIDLANPNDLILVAPGNYEELVVMSRPVRLQGWGAGSTRISAIKSPAEKLDAWRTRVQALATDLTYLLPAQEACTPGPACYDGNEPVLLFTEEGPGVLVMGRDLPPANAGRFGLLCSNGARPLASGACANGSVPLPNAVIDGFTITGADHAGGITVNAYAHNLAVGNNRIVGNQGVLGGGVRVGHAALVRETATGLVYENAANDNVAIHHNQVIGNSSLDGAGGGVALYTGSDNYAVTANWICGNFSTGHGAGIGHLGLSSGGRIAANTILFNENFNQGLNAHGAGLFVGGAAPLPGQTLSPGSGSVTIEANLIQGNQAGSGDGGGARLSSVNGQDAALPAGQRYRVEFFDNIVANNVAGLAGGGVSLQDVTRIRMIHNTIAHNDSLAIAGEAFVDPNNSAAQPGAGIVSRAHSPELQALLPAGQRFSNPQLVNSIVWRNRSFRYGPTGTNPPFGLLPQLTYDADYQVTGGATAGLYSDLAVLGTANAADRLDPRFSILTSTAGYHSSNVASDPAFARRYFNGNRGVGRAELDFTTGIQVPPAFDEGGNYIRPRFGPLTLTRPDAGPGTFYGNYHVTTGRDGQWLYGAGGLFDTAAQVPSELWLDFDGDPRSIRPLIPAHRGADQRSLLGSVPPPVGPAR